jgi:hypothetical protein
VGPRCPAPYKRRWGPAALITKLTVPNTPPTPQTLADLVVRRSQRRDCSPPAPCRRPTPPPSPVSAVSDPKVAGISSEPPPAPPRHRQSPWQPRRRQHPRGSRDPRMCVSHPLSLSYLDKIRLPRPNLCDRDLSTTTTSYQRHGKYSSAKPLCNVKEESNEFRSMDE